MNPAMQRRRFGRTELNMPVFSCGGMRYQHSWKDEDRGGITPENQAHVEATVHRALELGINHFETARGYGTSEEQLGGILPSLPREELIVQTKGGPREDLQEFVKNFETSMSHLKLDYVDLYGIHGLNNSELIEMAIKPGGCAEQALKWKEEGRIKNLGFSTHGTPDVIQAAVDTGLFDYMNFHCYFVNPLNRPVLEKAHELDMGVFIISPNEKGGNLFSPPEKLVELCQPLSPMQFNNLFCLGDDRIKTLSVGAARPGDFDAHVEGLKWWKQRDALVEEITERIRVEVNRIMGADWFDTWLIGLPHPEDTPGEMNIPDILRIFTFAKTLDLMDWGKRQYNLLGGSHWWPGNKAIEVDEDALAPLLKNSPHAERIPSLLKEAHMILDSEPQKRLSQGGSS